MLKDKGPTDFLCCNWSHDLTISQTIAYPRAKHSLSTKGFGIVNDCTGTYLIFHSQSCGLQLEPFEFSRHHGSRNDMTGRADPLQKPRDEMFIVITLTVTTTVVVTPLQKPLDEMFIDQRLWLPLRLEYRIEGSAATSGNVVDNVQIQPKQWELRCCL